MAFLDPTIPLCPLTKPFKESLNNNDDDDSMGEHANDEVAKKQPEIPDNKSEKEKSEASKKAEVHPKPVDKEVDEEERVKKLPRIPKLPTLQQSRNAGHDHLWFQDPRMPRRFRQGP